MLPIASLLLAAATSSVATSSIADLGADELVETGLAIANPFGQGDLARITVSGFIDFSYVKTHADRRSLISDFVQDDSFAVGHFNLYVGAELGEGWRSLAEVRFLYAPHGGLRLDYAKASITLYDGRFFDPVELNQRTWGGIEI